MEKRAQSPMTTVIVLIVFAAVTIILIVVYRALFVIGNSQFTEKECQSSLLLTKAADSAQPWCFEKLPNPVPLKCDRHFLSIKDGSVMKDGEDLTKLYSAACASGGNDCLQQKVVAEEMSTCWHTFLDGEHVLLQQVEVNDFTRLNNGKNYKRACFVCSEITISKQMNLLEYLKKEQMKSGTLYYDYLAKNEKAWCDKYLITKETPTCFEAMSAPMDAPWYKVPFQKIGIAEPDRPGFPLDNVQPGTYAVMFVRRGLGGCSNDKTANQNSGSYMRSNEGGFLTNAIELVPVDKVDQACDAVIV